MVSHLYLAWLSYVEKEETTIRHTLATSRMFGSIQSEELPKYEYGEERGIRDRTSPCVPIIRCLGWHPDKRTTFDRSQLD